MSITFDYEILAELEVYIEFLDVSNDTYLDVKRAISRERKKLTTNKNK